MPEITPKHRSLQDLETISKIFGTLAIPVVLALFGWLIQKQVATENLSRDYIQLAVGILKEPKKDGDEPLRTWAVDLLNSYSRVKLGAPTADALKKGDIVLPTAGAGVTFHTDDAMSVLASAGGLVTDVGTDRNRASTVQMDHGHGLTTQYSFRGGRILVEIGQLVRRGQPIAALDNGASGETNGFLFQVLQNGKPIDPTPYISGQSKKDKPFTAPAKVVPKPQPLRQ